MPRRLGLGRLGESVVAMQDLGELEAVRDQLRGAEALGDGEPVVDEIDHDDLRR